MHQPCLVIMAAGMGSRFGGPKQTTPVDEYGHFLLHYSLFDAYRAGFRKVVFVVKEETAEEFRESVGPAVAAAFDVRYAYQKLDTLPEGYTVPDGRTKPWGTAHAVLCAAPEIDGPFAVINSDDYYGIEAYRLLYDFLAVPRPERSYAWWASACATLSRQTAACRAVSARSAAVCSRASRSARTSSSAVRMPPIPRTVSTSSTCRAIRRCR